jgi:hypothetical protein
VLHIEMNAAMHYTVKTADTTYEGISLVIATGNKKLKPNIPGIEAFEGKGVSYCAICDGFFYRKKTVAVLGFAASKNFMPLVESAPVQAYSTDGSEVNLNDAFVRASLGGAGLGGFGSSGLSSMSAKNWLESLSSSSGSMFSGALSSAALKSNKLELPKDSVNYGKDFFLWVKTRLIVYGGTRPDAHLQVRGEPFPLNPDGTFSFEEDLPDSTKIIPVFATDKDGDFPTTIVPIVVKRTE